MPAPALPEQRNPQLLTVLFWIGVAIAPIAALILLVADGNGPLRFAAVLAIMAVVLIGLSIALRNDSGGPARSEEFLDELEQLRRELRSEIVAAAQRGNQALDHAQRVDDQVSALRRRLDAAAAGIAAAAGLTGVEEPAGAGRARVPAPEPHDDAAGGRRRAAEESPAWGRATADRDDEPAGSRYATDRPAAGQANVYGSARAAAPDPGGRPVVRHTETVHVTTRHTVVDGADPGVAGSYGGYTGRWSPAGEEPSWNAPEPDHARAGQRDERPWAGQRDERAWSGGPAEERSWPEERSWDGRSDDRADGSWAGGSYSADEGWSGVRVGDRWAQVREDGRAREVRVGERRAEVHADGAEFRMQDRWASVRQDEPRQSGDRYGGGWTEPEDRPALPQGGVPVPQEWRTSAAGWQPAEEQWSPQQPAGQWRPPAPREPVDAWRAPEPESSDRQRWGGGEGYGYPPQDEAPRAGGRWR